MVMLQELLSPAVSCGKHLYLNTINRSENIFCNTTEYTRSMTKHLDYGVLLKAALWVLI